MADFQDAVAKLNVRTLGSVENLDQSEKSEVWA